MKDEETRIELYGKVVTGWRATCILLAALLALVLLGFRFGYMTGLHHVCG